MAYTYHVLFVFLYKAILYGVWGHFYMFVVIQHFSNIPVLHGDEAWFTSFIVATGK